MKTKRKVLIGTTMAIAIGAMAGGATLTANAMGTTSPESKVRAVVGTVTPAADGKGMVSCTFTDVELPAIALPINPEPGNVEENFGGIDVTIGEALPLPALGSGAEGSAVVAPEAPEPGMVVESFTVKSTDGGTTFTITDKDGNTRTVTGPEVGMTVDSLLPIPFLGPEGPVPPQGVTFPTGSGAVADVRQGSSDECAAMKPGAAGVPALPVLPAPAAPAPTEGTEGTTKN